MGVDPVVAALRRYPVKAMAGEPLRSVRVDRRGLVGDRWYAVVDEQGHLASGKDSRRFRRHDEVFGYGATTGPDGAVTVVRGDRTWVVGDPRLDRHLSESFGTAVEVRPEDRTPHQDDGQVSLVGTATLRWCAERWGDEPDPRRTRMNVVVETDEPFAEEAWVGQLLVLGSTRLNVVSPVPRCRMLDVTQDGVRPTRRWLRPLAVEREMNLGVYADVRQPGEITVGDAVRPAWRT
jgi:uncharacterized protein